jgi:RHS repeat-associated protein
MGDRLATAASTGFAWIVPDLHGNVAAQCSSSGSVSDVFRYDPYGKLIGTSLPAGSVPSPWRFQGRILESTAGSDTYDFGARAYVPDLGTFTSLDSVAGSAQNPITLNRYLYADANPATLVDPDGHCSLALAGANAQASAWCQTAIANGEQDTSPATGASAPTSTKANTDKKTTPDGNPNPGPQTATHVDLVNEWWKACEYGNTKSCDSIGSAVWTYGYGGHATGKDWQLAARCYEGEHQACYWLAQDAGNPLPSTQTSGCNDPWSCFVYGFYLAPVGMLQGVGSCVGGNFQACAGINPVTGPAMLGASIGSDIYHQNWNGLAYSAGGVTFWGMTGAAVGGFGEGGGLDTPGAGDTWTWREQQPNLTNLDSKISGQMPRRGWTVDQMERAIEQGEQVPAVNKAAGNAATRYKDPWTGQSIVVDDYTGQVIQVGGPGFHFGIRSGDAP